MKSIKEVLISDEFESEAPEGIKFLIRRVRREEMRKEKERIELKEKTENKNLKLAV